MSAKPIIHFEVTEENPRYGQVRDVSPQAVLEEKEKLHIIDVRRPDEFTGELGHIPGAQLFTLEIFPQEMVRLPKDETIIFVCRSGGRSSQASAFALESGFKSVFNMKGGMLLWNQLNLATEGSSKSESHSEASEVEKNKFEGKNT